MFHDLIILSVFCPFIASPRFFLPVGLAYFFQLELLQKPTML
jgi:hypothetical protein